MQSNSKQQPLLRTTATSPPASSGGGGTRALSAARLVYLSLAAWVVIAGVVAKNGIAEASWGRDLAMYVGAPLFVVGWILVAYELARVKGGRVAEQVVIVICSLAILVSAAASSMYMSDSDGQTGGPQMPPIALPIVFGVAWLILGALAGNTPLGRFVGFLGAAAIVVAMVVFMPFQRAHGVVDGPGMPLFAIGWSVLAFAHALVLK